MMQMGFDHLLLQCSIKMSEADIFINIASLYYSDEAEVEAKIDIITLFHSHK